MRADSVSVTAVKVSGVMPAAVAALLRPDMKRGVKTSPRCFDSGEPISAWRAFLRPLLKHQCLIVTEYAEDEELCTGRNADVESSRSKAQAAISHNTSIYRV